MSLPKSLIAGLAVGAVTLTVTVTVVVKEAEDDRSVKAYCTYFYKQGTTFRNRYITADQNMNSDPVGSFVTLLGAQADMAQFFDGLAKHAPDEIQGDVQQVAHSLQKSSDDASGVFTNPLGTLAGNLVTGLQSAPAFQRVDDYTTSKCGPPPGTKWTQGS